MAQNMEQRVVELEGLAGQMRQTIEDLNGHITQQAQTIAAMNANAAAAIQAIGQQAGAGGGGGQVIKLNRYAHDAQDKDKRTVGFLRWLSHLKHCAHANHWNVQRTIDTALGSLDGVAADTTRAMVRTADAYDDNAETFFISLTKKFVSATYETVARTRFFQRHQEADESIEVYHGQLAALYEQAYARVDEPWRYQAGADPPDPWQANDPVGFRSGRLMEQFVAGIRSYTIKSQLRLSHTLVGIPATYDALLERVMSLEGHQEQNAYESKMIGRGKDHTPANKPPPRRDEPMDITALTRKVGELEKKYFGQQRGRVGAANAGGANRGEKWCTYHKVSSHDSKECRVLRNDPSKRGGQEQRNPGNRQPGAGGGPPGQQGGPPRYNNNQRAAGQGAEKLGPQCRNCKGFGHIYNQCPSPKKKVAGLTEPGEPAEGTEQGHESDDSQWEFDGGSDSKNG